MGFFMLMKRKFIFFVNLSFNLYVFYIIVVEIKENNKIDFGLNI